MNLVVKLLLDYFFYLILFFLGAILMRSAGCIVNDILDRKFDKKVSRTKNRPIAASKISVGLAFVLPRVIQFLNGFQLKKIMKQVLQIVMDYPKF